MAKKSDAEIIATMGAKIATYQYAIAYAVAMASTKETPNLIPIFGIDVEQETEINTLLSALSDLITLPEQHNTCS